MGNADWTCSDPGLDSTDERDAGRQLRNDGQFVTLGHNVTRALTDWFLSLSANRKEPVVNTMPQESQHERVGPPDSTDSSVSRRTIVRGVAWSMPVIAAAAAVPLAAASTKTRVNLWSTARLPTNQRDGLHKGLNYYQGPRSLNFVYTFGNLGPDELPIGGILTFGLPFAAIWETASFVITSSGGYPLAPVGTRTETINNVSVPATRRLWDFVLGAPLPAGSSFSVTFTVQMNATSNSATNLIDARTTSNFQPGGNVADTDQSNNRDYSDAYAYFNNENAKQ